MIQVKKNIKKGFTILFIYTLITMCLLMASKRIERLDNVNNSNFRNTNNSIVVKLNK
ncbi:MAG: hypothetical protein IJF92_01175 [Bacilli bacterium]|nr:hypothetical protein [Bacilli bacterium]